MELIATKRTELGKKSKTLRNQRKVPGVIYAKGEQSVPVTLDLFQFEKVFKQAGETSLIDVTIDSKAFGKVLVSEIDYHPVKDIIVHVNLRKVNLKEKIKAQIPIVVVGESPIVKGGEGLLLTLINEIEVEALPADLPHSIEVDISGLTEVDQGIEVKDLKIDRSKVEIVDRDEDELVVKIDYAEMKEEPEAVAVEAPTEADLVAKVAATEQLTDEEKAAKEKAKKEADEKAKK